MRTRNLMFSNPKFGNVRAKKIDGEPWLVGKDVVTILKYQNGSRDINRHVDEEDRRKIMMYDGDQAREMILINESGLYSLILGSKLPQAKEFKHWVTSEVLPSIRKTGNYTAPTAPAVPAPEPLDYMGAIDVILKASNGQLPYVVSLLRQQGYDLPEPAEVATPKSDRKYATDMRKLMEEYHVTQKELSRRTGIGKTTLSNYMNCKSRPTSERYDMIVQAIIG